MEELELEALFVRIYAQFGEYTSAVPNVLKLNQQMIAGFNETAIAVDRLEVSMSKLAGTATAVMAATGANMAEVLKNASAGVTAASVAAATTATAVSAGMATASVAAMTAAVTEPLRAAAEPVQKAAEVVASAAVATVASIPRKIVAILRDRRAATAAEITEAFAGITNVATEGLQYTATEKIAKVGSMKAILAARKAAKSIAAEIIVAVPQEIAAAFTGIDIPKTLLAPQADWWAKILSPTLHGAEHPATNTALIAYRSLQAQVRLLRDSLGLADSLRVSAAVLQARMAEYTLRIALAGGFSSAASQMPAFMIRSTALATIPRQSVDAALGARALAMFEMSAHFAQAGTVGLISPLLRLTFVFSAMTVAVNRATTALAAFGAARQWVPAFTIPGRVWAAPGPGMGLLTGEPTPSWIVMAAAWMVRAYQKVAAVAGPVIAQMTMQLMQGGLLPMLGRGGGVVAAMLAPMLSAVLPAGLTSALASGLPSLSGALAASKTLFSSVASGAGTLAMSLWDVARGGTAAAGRIGSLNRSLGSLLWGGYASGGAIRFLQFGIAALVGFSIGAFARFDDSIIRTLARMGDYTQANRFRLEAESLAISSRSITSASELNTALGTLASSGMNAAMAARALGTAENYAVASHQEMVASTRQLVDIMGALGLASANVETHHANMTRLSDVLMRTHQLVDASVQQLTESFTGRYTAALRDANIPLEQGVALVAAYSAAQIRGSEAGNRAAILINTLATANINNLFRWEQMGLRVFDAAGQMRPMADIIEQLENRLGGMSTMQRHATLSVMGFTNMTSRAIMPILGMSHVIREMETELLRAGGTTQSFADLIRTSFESQLKILLNNLMNLLMMVGRVLAPALAMLNEGFQNLSRWFVGLNPAVQAFVTWMGVLAIIAVPLGGVFGMLVGKLLSWAAALAVLVGVLAVWSPLVLGLAVAVPSIFIGALTLTPLVISMVSALFALIFGGLETLSDAGGALWKSMTPAMMTFFDLLDKTWFSAEGHIVHGWRDIKESALGTFQDIRAGVTNLSGFFWNLSENMHSIFAWLGRDNNWKTMLIDAVALSIAFAGNMMHNLRVIFQFISTSSATVWTSFWSVGVNLGGRFFGWLFTSLGTMLSNTWHNAGIGLGGVIERLGLKLRYEAAYFLHSIADTERTRTALRTAELDLQIYNDRLSPLEVYRNQVQASNTRYFADMARITGPLREMPALGSPGPHTQQEAYLQNQQRLQAALQMYDSQRIRGITEGIPHISEAFSGVGTEIGSTLSGMFGGIFEQWQRMTGQTRGLFEGFSPLTGEGPVLNLTLPDTAFADLQERMNRLFTPQHGEDDFATEIAGRHGPGSLFKQISEERFVLGGPVNAMMDRQFYIMETTVGHRLDVLINLTRGNRPMPILGN